MEVEIPDVDDVEELPEFELPEDIDEVEEGGDDWAVWGWRARLLIGISTAGVLGFITLVVTDQITDRLDLEVDIRSPG